MASAGVARPAAAEDSVAVPSFVEETASAGIDSVYAGEWEYMVGGGVATFDCNGDGFDDMLLAGGASPAKFYRNASTRGGALRFKAETSGLELDKVTGAYPLDIDSDGITDLVLLRVGENVVMRGLGGCRFERANEAWGFDGGDAWSTALAATWEHGADWPTIAIGNYIDRNEDMSPWGSCTDNWLHRPEIVDGKSARRFAAPLPLKPSFCALSMLFTDWNKSGTPSLRVSNDREYYEGGQEQLWHVEPGKAPALYTDAEGWKLLRIWGMGIASADLNGDGYPEYFLTSMADNKLQTLAAIPQDGKPMATFNDVAFAKGVTAYRPYTGGDWHPSTAWHAQFEDVNNDGLVDLFIAKGNVAKMPDFAMKDPNNLLLQTRDGKFQEVGDSRHRQLRQSPRRGSGRFQPRRLAGPGRREPLGERADMAQHQPERRPLDRGQAAAAGPNLDPRRIGAWLEVRCGSAVMRREITVGGGHASGQAGWWHFGLGDTPQAEVRVIWPDGTSGDWQAVDSNNFYILARGKPAQLWAAK